MSVMLKILPYCTIRHSNLFLSIKKNIVELVLGTANLFINIMKLPDLQLKRCTVIIVQNYSWMPGDTGSPKYVHLGLRDQFFSRYLQCDVVA